MKQRKLYQATIIVCFVFGFSVNAFSAFISFDLQIANPGVSIFRITNTSSDPTAQITGFSVTIGDEDYNFDIVSNASPLIDTPAPLIASLLTGDTNQDGVRTDTVEWLFTGFDQNDKFQFQTDIDIDNNNTDEVFNQVLFNNGSASNAVIEVSFLAGTETGKLSLTLPDAPPATTYNYSASGETAPVPEPTTLLLFLTGLAGLAGLSRRKE